MKNSHKIEYGTPIKYKGPTWNSARKQIKIKFAKAGLLNTCEIPWDECNGDLTFAHSKRRKYISDKDEMEMVIRACVKHHAILDANKHDVVYNTVKDVIDNRVTPVESIYDKKGRNPRRF